MKQKELRLCIENCLNESRKTKFPNNNLMLYPLSAQLLPWVYIKAMIETEWKCMNCCKQICYLKMISLKQNPTEVTADTGTESGNLLGFPLSKLCFSQSPCPQTKTWLKLVTRLIMSRKQEHSTTSTSLVWSFDNIYQAPMAQRNFAEVLKYETDCALTYPLQSPVRKYT